MEGATTKKIDKEFVLSDSSKNVYGFKLLTSGYQLKEYQKFPIGFFNHEEEEGPLVKWEDIRVDGDLIKGKPVINLNHPRGQRTVQEIEDGFVTGASVGKLVILETVMEDDPDEPGKTMPVVTKWYNKECSVVDLPANRNASIQLFDINDKEINLSDLTTFTIHKNADNNMKQITLALTPTLIALLSLSDNADADAVMAGINKLSLRASGADSLIAEHKNVVSENTILKAENLSLKDSAAKQEIELMLKDALRDKKITAAEQAVLQKQFSANPDGLKELLAVRQPFTSITTQLRDEKQSSGVTPEGWSWDDYQQKDPSGKRLKNLRDNNPDEYKRIFNEKFYSDQD